MGSLFKDKKNLVILLGIVIFIILRIPSLYEPYWYGDEGIYAAVSQEMSAGESLYKDIWDNKPPLIYWIFMLAGQTNTMFKIRSLNLIAGIVTIIGIYKLIKKVLGGNVALIPFFLIIYVLGSPHIEGNIANGENFFLPFIVWGLYLGLGSTKNKLKQILAGSFFSLAMLFKINGVADIGALVIFILVTETDFFKKGIHLRELVKLSNLFLGFIIPILAVSIYCILQGSFEQFIGATVLDMLVYVGSGSEKKGETFIQLSGMMKLLLLLISTIIISVNYFSKRISKAAFFILLVFAFEYFGTLISARHYIHYLLQLIPAFALLSAFTLNYISRQKSVISRVNVVVLYILGCFLALINFTQGEGLLTNYAGWHFPGKSPYYKIYAYYKNFFDYKIIKRVDKQYYNYFFNDEENKILALEEALNLEFADIGKDQIYIYTDRAWTYALLDIRVPTIYSVAYHRYITKGGDEKLVEGLELSMPELIILEKGIDSYDRFDKFLSDGYRYSRQDELYLYYVKE